MLAQASFIFLLCISAIHAKDIHVFTSTDGISTEVPNYYPDWKSIDSRPIPDWYDKAKIGIFMHWGVYSVPSFSSEWFWVDWKGTPSPNPKAQKEIEQFMRANYKPGFTYQDFAPMFTAEFFNASHWAEIVKSSGAKYFVITSKHHEGFTMWPSKYSKNWNSVDTGPHRDIIGELQKAIKHIGGVKFGVYHSLYEWFHPLYLADKATNFTTQTFVDQKIFPEMVELVERYAPEILWSDGDWEAPDRYWRSTEFLSWLYTKSRVANTVAVNDRWGAGIMCHHGGYLTCSDRYHPGVLQPKKWENAMTIDKNTWGYSRLSNIDDYLSNKELIDTLVTTVAVGGNLLMNVGPTKEGTIMPLFQERLRAVGKWLESFGEAIYETQPWQKCQSDITSPEVWYTTKDNVIYAILLKWPNSGQIVLSCVTNSKNTSISLLGNDWDLKWREKGEGLVINLPPLNSDINDYAWVLKISNSPQID